MRTSTATDATGGRARGDAVDAALDALSRLDDAGVRTVIGRGLAGLDDAGVRTVVGRAVAGLGDSGRLGVADALLAEVGDAAALTVAGEALGRLAANPLAGDVDDAALAVSVERLQRMEATVAGEKLRRVAEMAARGSSRVTGDRSPADLLCRLGLTRGEAASQVAAAAALRRLPARAALERGDIGLGHAATAARTLGQLADAGGPVAGETVDRLDRLVAGTAGGGSTPAAVTPPTVATAATVTPATVGWSPAGGGGWTGASWAAGSTGSRTRSTTTCSPTGRCAPSGCAGSR